METTILGYIGYRIWGILLGLYIGIMEKGNGNCYMIIGYMLGL